MHAPIYLCLFKKHIANLCFILLLYWVDLRIFENELLVVTWPVVEQDYYTLTAGHNGLWISHRIVTNIHSFRIVSWNQFTILGLTCDIFSRQSLNMPLPAIISGWYYQETSSLTSRPRRNSRPHLMVVAESAQLHVH